MRYNAPPRSSIPLPPFFPLAYAIARISLDAARSLRRFKAAGDQDGISSSCSGVLVRASLPEGHMRSVNRAAVISLGCLLITLTSSVPAFAQAAFVTSYQTTDFSGE